MDTIYYVAIVLFISSTVLACVLRWAYLEWKKGLDQNDLYVKNSPHLCIEHRWQGSKIEGKDSVGMKILEIRDLQGKPFTARVYFRPPGSEFNHCFATIKSNSTGVVRIRTWLGPKATVFGFVINREPRDNFRVIRNGPIQYEKPDYNFEPNPIHKFLCEIGLM